jgi:hypothetical protein
MELEGSLPCSQQATTGLYHEQHKSHNFTTYFFNAHLNIVLPSTPRSSTLFSQTYPLIFYTHFSPSLCLLCSWLGHYSKSRKVTGSIPDEVIGFFSWPNPSSRTITFKSTQPLTEMSIRNLPGGGGGGKGRPASKSDLTAICEPIVYQNVAASTSDNTMGVHGLLQGQFYNFTYAC